MSKLGVNIETVNKSRKPKKNRTPCEPAKHNYMESNKTPFWKGHRYIVIFCTQCGQTEFIGTIDENTEAEKESDSRQNSN